MVFGEVVELLHKRSRPPRLFPEMYWPLRLLPLGSLYDDRLYRVRYHMAQVRCEYSPELSSAVEESAV